MWLLVSFLDVLSIGLPFCFIASPLPSFQNQLVFNSTLMKDFGKLLGSTSLKCLEAFPVHRQVVFPIFSWGIKLISLEVIASIAYIWSWALMSLNFFS
jgi:hypothetical protein